MTTVTGVWADELLKVSRYNNDLYKAISGGLAMTVRYDELEQTKAMLEAAIQKLEAAELLLHRSKNLLFVHDDQLSAYVANLLVELDIMTKVSALQEIIHDAGSAQFDRPEVQVPHDCWTTPDTCINCEPAKCHPDCVCCKGCDA